MTQTILDNDVDLSLKRVKRWRNLWFLKDGSFHPGAAALETKDECEMRGGKDLAFARQFPSRIGHFVDGFSCENRLVSHFIPMPLSDDE